MHCITLFIIGLTEFQMAEVVIILQLSSYSMLSAEMLWPNLKCVFNTCLRIFMLIAKIEEMFQVVSSQGKKSFLVCLALVCVCSYVIKIVHSVQF